jgi:uncharacterized protein YjdB
MLHRYFKKIIAILVIVVLVVSSSDYLNGSLAFASSKKVNIKKILTNEKAVTLCIGDIFQIETKVEPLNASDKDMVFETSNEKVASVSIDGLVKANAPGEATITIMAHDGSEKTAKIKIKVLKDLIIDSDDIKTNQKVIIKDDTYGNVMIRSSVGKSKISLDNVTIRGVLTLESSVDYTITMLSSIAKEVEVIEANTDDQIISFLDPSVSEKSPTLMIGEASHIFHIKITDDVKVKQHEKAVIDKIAILSELNNNTNVVLEGYHGLLDIDEQQGNFNLSIVNCSLTKVNVTGGDKSSSIILDSKGISSIDSLILEGKINLDLNVPAKEVIISNTSNGIIFTAGSTIKKLLNEGMDNTVVITGEISDLDTIGDNGKLNVTKDGKITAISLSGDNTLLFGKGKVLNIYITADNCGVNILDAYLKIDGAKGTKIFDTYIPNVITANTTYYVKNIEQLTSKDGNRIILGDHVVNSSFEDYKYGIYMSMGGGNGEIIDIGYGNKALFVSKRTSQSYGAGFNFYNYLGLNIQFLVQANMKCEVDGDYRIILKTNTGDVVIAERKNCIAGEWYTLLNTFRIDESYTYANLYFEAPGTSNYYLDNVKIVVDYLPIKLQGVFIDETKTLKKEEEFVLRYNTFPSEAEVNYVNWTSSHPEVATIDPYTGRLKALKRGKTDITVEIRDKLINNIIYRDTCTVTVTD